MRLNAIHTTFLLMKTAFYTVRTCIKTIFKSINRTLTAQWCDEELQRWIGHVLKVIQVQYTIINPNHVTPQPGVPTIIMCNHTSLFDIPISYTVFPHISLRMLAKKELFNIPFFGKAMTLAKFPCINRHNRKQAIQDLQIVEGMLKSGIVMWIAPEGTRSLDGKLGPLKKGGMITAINTHATIIPIGIRGANKILPAKTFKLSLGQPIEVHVGKPIDTNRFTLNQKDQLRQLVSQEMKKLVGDQ